MLFKVTDFPKKAITGNSTHPPPYTVCVGGGERWGVSTALKSAGATLCLIPVPDAHLEAVCFRNLVDYVSF